MARRRSRSSLIWWLFGAVAATAGAWQLLRRNGAQHEGSTEAVVTLHIEGLRRGSVTLTGVSLERALDTAATVLRSSCPLRLPLQTSGVVNASASIEGVSKLGQPVLIQWRPYAFYQDFAGAHMVRWDLVEMQGVASTTLEGLRRIQVEGNMRHSNTPDRLCR